jgi:hypothetical protein
VLVLDEILPHIPFLGEAGELRQVADLRGSGVIAEPEHSFQGGELAVDGGILGALLQAAVDIFVDRPAVDICDSSRAEERLQVFPPTPLGVLQALAAVEIEESWEAPHAIENSKRVYVRTGNGANPYELADVDLIIELVRRRAEPQAKRERLLSVARKRASNVLLESTIHAEISASPSYPRRVLCTREDCWNFVENSRYRRAHYFPFETMRRVEDGVASYNRGSEYLNSASILYTRF